MIKDGDIVRVRDTYRLLDTDFNNCDDTYFRVSECGVYFYTTLIGLTSGRRYSSVSILVLVPLDEIEMMVVMTGDEIKYEN